jgi:hypothetical protein
MLVYDPINLENLPVADYLDNDANNIVIIYNNKAYGVNKSLFMFNNEMKRCIIANNALLKKKTYDNQETFYNIGYFIGKKAIVNQNKLNDVLKEHRVFELTSKTSGDTYINKELLELTTIGLIKPSSKKSVGKFNFQYAYEDVYFDELISLILKQYSLSMYFYINKCLLNSKLYNNDKPLKKELAEVLKNDFPKSKVFKNIDFKNHIDNIITKIDKGFIEAAPRYEKTYIHKVFYRGMKGKYININGKELENIGDTALIKTYVSVSADYATAKNFAPPGGKAAIYIIYLEEGLPFINMVSNAVFKNEREYILPRNIIFELISKNGNEYTVLAKPFKPDQFTIKTGCFPLDFYDIKHTQQASQLAQLSQLSQLSLPAKISLSSPAKSKTKSNIDSGKNNIIPVKSKRCPNGMVRNKITKECVPKQNIKQKAKPEAKLPKLPKSPKSPKSPKAKPESPKPKSKLGRCPKGTRRNPKTLLCEAKV